MKRMYADFDDQAYSDLKSGKAIDSNGFRKADGSYHPNQPSYQDIPDEDDTGDSRAKEALIDLAIDAGRALVFGIIVPGMCRFCKEKVYPSICEKWDDFKEKRQEKKAQKQAKTSATEVEIEVDNSTTEVSDACENDDHKVIQLSDYKKVV